ncbi:MAG: Holliday junction branch migration protein RuvA [Candidatus Cloacimonetes bacterium]|nr:Holliday junction branch migration protein RuvA [Candidatus Cloacimonadota bacterium]
MFSYLKGSLAEKAPVHAVIDCNGVGYDINIPLRTFDRLPEIGKEIQLFIHFSFTESDGIRLFGFYSLDEKKLFKQLISISKIGPKTALSVLSTLSVSDLVNAVQMGNIGLISTVPGIGKKSAERLIIELKDKVKNIMPENLGLPSNLMPIDILVEAETALTTLGYNTIKVKKTISLLMKENKFKNSEEIIKAVMKYLYRK